MLTYSISNWTSIDPGVSFSSNCPPCTVGIDESLANKEDVSIFPIPTSHQLSIISNQLNINRIDIINITGKALKTITTDLNSINVANLPSGIYFIKLVTDVKTITKKFVKQ